MQTNRPRGLNRQVLRFFAPLLVLTGLGGFLIPPELGLMSGAPLYNIFHIIFGILGVCLAMRGERESAFFNLAFGFVDLYQALASWAHLFPVQHFRWKPADDVLHVVVGLALALIGAKALPASPAPSKI
mgnify:CR=1 FL=1